MAKKEIIIIVVSGIVAFLIGFFITFSLTSGGKENLKVGKFTLDYGTYKGYSEEYDPDTKKTNKNELKIELTKNKIKSDGGEKSYTVKKDGIYVDGIMMYQVTGNNKFVLMAGSGVEFNYEK